MVLCQNVNFGGLKKVRLQNLSKRQGQKVWLCLHSKAGPVSCTSSEWKHSWKCLICKELSLADCPSWDAWGESEARALPPGLVQLWISSWCWHWSIPIKESLPLARLQFLQSQSLFRGVRIFQCSAGPRVDMYGPEAQKRNKSIHLALCHCCRPLSSFLFPK